MVVKKKVVHLNLDQPALINPGDKDGYSERNRPSRPQFETPAEIKKYKDLLADGLVEPAGP